MNEEPGGIIGAIAVMVIPCALLLALVIPLGYTLIHAIIS
jgi:hypothetical protein